MPFDLVADVTCFAGRVRAQVEREAQHAVDALAREHRLLEHDLALGALVHAAAHRRVLALGVLADDDEVDVARLAVGERRRDAGHQLARAQVHVLVELAAEQDERAPQRHVVGDRRGPADRAVVDRLERGQLREPVVRHHLPVRGVVVAAPVERREREIRAELARRGLDDAQALRHHFLADPVSRDHRDPVRRHRTSPEKAQVYGNPGFGRMSYARRAPEPHTLSSHGVHRTRWRTGRRTGRRSAGH